MIFSDHPALENAIHEGSRKAPEDPTEEEDYDIVEKDGQAGGRVDDAEKEAGGATSISICERSNESCRDGGSEEA